MKPITEVLAVRFATNKRLEFIPLKHVYEVHLKETLFDCFITESISFVIVKCAINGNDLVFKYDQFQEPECFDLICEHYGLESALDPTKREEFRAKRNEAFDKEEKENEKEENETSPLSNWRDSAPVPELKLAPTDKVEVDERITIRGPWSAIKVIIRNLNNSMG